MAELPRGTVTFLFTDVEQSTRLLAELGADAYGNALEEHRSRLRKAFRAGHEVDTQGDSLFYRLRPRGRRRRRGGRRAASPRRIAAPRPHGPPHGPAVDHGRRLRRPRRPPRGAHLRGGTRRPGGALADDAGPRRRRDARPRRASPQGPDAAAAAVPARRTRARRREFPPLRTLENRPTNLPAQATPLVGRAAELDALQALLADDGRPPRDADGPGRHGQDAARASRGGGDASSCSRTASGSWRSRRSTIRRCCCRRSRRRSGCTNRATGRSTRVVHEHLAGQRVLLVLDNFEQLLDAARTVGDLLDAAPGCKVLVTSRAPLRMAAEHAFPVPPLALAGSGLAAGARVALAVRGGGALPRARAGRRAELRRHGRERAGGRGALRAARRAAARDRARRGARQAAAAAGAAGAPRAAARAPPRRRARPAGAAADAARGARLELRPARRGAAEGVRTLERLRRRFPSRCSRIDRRRGPRHGGRTAREQPPALGSSARRRAALLHARDDPRLRQRAARA